MRSEANTWVARAGFLEVCQREPAWRLRKREFLRLEAV